SFDGEGNLKVDRVPVVGDAADAYERAITVAAVSTGETFVKNDLNDLRVKFADDPKAFSDAARLYGETKSAQYGKLAGADAGLAIGRIAGEYSSAIYRSLSTSKMHRDLNAASGEIRTRAASRADDLV